MEGHFKLHLQSLDGDQICQ